MIPIIIQNIPSKTKAFMKMEIFSVISNFILAVFTVLNKKNNLILCSKICEKGG